MLHTPISSPLALQRAETPWVLTQAELDADAADRAADDAADAEWDAEDDARDGDLFDAERWADEADHLYELYRDRQWELAR